MDTVTVNDSEKPFKLLGQRIQPTQASEAVWKAYSQLVNRKRQRFFNAVIASYLFYLTPPTFCTGGLRLRLFGKEKRWIGYAVFGRKDAEKQKFRMMPLSSVYDQYLFNTLLNFRVEVERDWDFQHPAKMNVEAVYNEAMPLIYNTFKNLGLRDEELKPFNERHFLFRRWLDLRILDLTLLGFDLAYLQGNILKWDKNSWRQNHYYESINVSMQKRFEENCWRLVR